MEQKSIERLTSLIAEGDKNTLESYQKDIKNVLKKVDILEDTIKKIQNANARAINRLEKIISQQSQQIQQMNSKVYSLQNKSVRSRGG